jgi:hypothetical protein
MAAHMVPFPERPDSVRAHDAHDVASHPRNAMAGLVLGVTTEERVTRGGRGGRASAPPPAPAPAAARQLRLFVQERAPDSAGRPPRRGYVLQQGEAPAADSVVSPGTPLVLVRGERTAITVVNRLREPTTVHWHGMELESLFDGVAGWSGARTSLAPLVAPGDSFAVAFTPPRAGTFIYHTHMDEGSQLRTGLYGPMLVLEPGERLDPATDHVLMVGGVVAGRRSVPGVNGRVAPAPLELRAGVTHRLRLVNILPTIPVRAELRLALPADTTLVAWRPLSKDGATLPAALRRDAPARQWIGVGETFDFTWTPARPMTATLTFVLPEEERPNVLRVPVRVVP